MQEFDHTIPSNVLHEIEGVDSVLEYFSLNVEAKDKLQAMLQSSSQDSELPPNLVLQVEPIRFDTNDKSLFPTTAFPGRSTIVSGLAQSHKYPSQKVSKRRRMRIDAEDLA